MKRFASAALIFVAAVSLWFASSEPAPPAFISVRNSWRPSDAQLLDRNGEPIHELRINRYGRRLGWTPLGDISPALKEAVVTSEDHRFWSHRGVDLIAIAGSIVHALAGGRARGASTVTMQLASLLNPARGRSAARRSVRRKLSQMRTALALERRWSKQQILEAYLNLVTYRGEIQGIGAASRVMFGKMPHGLDGAESVVLASLIRAPNARRIAVATRADALCRTIGSAAPSERDVAGAIQRAFTNRPGAFVRATLAPHVAQRLLNADTGAVRCTLDRDLQQLAIETLRRHVFEVRDRRVDDGAVIVLENSTGEVWAYVGGAGNLSSAPEFDAARAPRQPGSTLKPFLYAAALDRHLLTAASLLQDTPLELSEPRGIYRPLDYDRQFRGLVSMRTALASSLNVPAVRTAEMLGVEEFADTLRRLGFGGISEQGDFYGAALALGSADVSLWELVNAYRTLANGGRYSRIQLTTSANTQLDSASVYSPAAAFIVSDILADRASRSATFGLENSLATRDWSAVKTGTSKDMRDNWCVGYTRRFTVGVWVGNSSGVPMHDVSGITGAAPVWLDVMNYLHDRFGSGEIERPADVVASGVQFSNAVEPPRREWFIPNTQPVSNSPSLDNPSTRILSPAPGATIALDPDIPARDQRIAFEAGPGAAGARWLMDGRPLAPVHGVFLWTPSAGSHTLSVTGNLGTRLDSIAFSVRGSAARDLVQDDSSPDTQLQ
jgi:penicillin-binding protein 1C